MILSSIASTTRAELADGIPLIEEVIS